ncbi:hypothetical protein [Phytoactinopolyspora halotolerans]|uniref:Uncharacterized protein n=1 Tax=Phytoactinopolyspora halotolerans TaxID=1981512 RepID=A0A6L9SCT0_9ACTN|nr:hypothetical protein [Phytoactinopolyspora halotolerans]NEE02368.1 hypothetical protein [Phytoactinopolyspora halotolerans]
MRISPLLLAIPVLALTACSEVSDAISDGISDRANSMASQALEDGIRDQLAGAGIELAGDPDCSTDLTQDNLTLTGTADCSATTADGQAATATFDGTLSSSGCSGTVTIAVEGRTVVDSQRVPNCSISL